MNHYCGGRIIYLKDESIWYCQRCGDKHFQLQDFITDPQKVYDEDYLLDELGLV